jgi:hypothetical protein
MSTDEYIALAVRLKMFGKNENPTTMSEVNKSPEIRIAMGLFTAAELLPILHLKEGGSG